jgi:hypothetical protein
VDSGLESIKAHGVALVDVGGVSKLYNRASPFEALGYRVATFRDDDAKPDVVEEGAFEARGSRVFRWRANHSTERELFTSLTVAAVAALLEFAVEVHGEDLVDSHLRSSSNNEITLAGARDEIAFDLSLKTREILARASTTKNNPWFKTVSYMEHIGRYMVGPDLARAEAGFRDFVAALFAWAADA